MSRDVSRLEFHSLGLGLKTSSLGLGLDNHSNPLTSPVSVSAVTVSTACGVDSVFTDVRCQGLRSITIMRSLLDKIFCVPPSSAPAEHVFDHGGVIIRPHRVRLGDQMLSALVYLKCMQ